MCGMLQRQTTPRALGPGHTLSLQDSRIVVDKRIGEGGMGEVFRAWLFHDPNGPLGKEPAKLLALKTLRPEYVVDDLVRSTFANESKVLRRIQHPNIIEYVDMLEFSGQLIVVLEYIDGQSLEDVIARHVARARINEGAALPALPLLRAWFYFQQLLGALASSHALGIVHRDIKPSNVLIRQDGLVKLTDFGIARLTEPHAQGTVQITRGHAPGTGMYMSPEQVLSQPVDARADLYSAAIVLFEMLAGRPPFPAEGSEFVVRRHQVETPPPLVGDFAPQAPRSLDDLLQKALAKDPEKRFSSAIEMGDAFRQALNLPISDEWVAQGQFALSVRSVHDTRVEDMPVQQLATTGAWMAQRYRTMKLVN